jgi:hypothetical protein
LIKPYACHKQERAHYHCGFKKLRGDKFDNGGRKENVDEGAKKLTEKSQDEGRLLLSRYFIRTILG